MRKLLLLLSLFLLLPNTVKAGASPPMSFQEALGWRHIIEQGDLLVIGRYELDADGTITSTCGVSTDWDDCSASDAYVDLVDEDGSLIERITLPFLGSALTGFYLTAAEITASSIDFDDPAHDAPMLTIYSSSVLFVPNTVLSLTLAIQPSITATASQSLSDLASQIVRLIQIIETTHTDTDLTDPYTFTQNELVEDGRITLEGRRFATAVSPIIPVMVPSSFQLAATLFTEAMGADYQSFLSENEAIGSTTIDIVDTSPFTANDIIRIRDTAGEEILTIISVDSNTQLTTDSDPDTGGNQGTVNAYTTANLGHISLVGFFSQRADAVNPSKTALETLMSEFGIATWAGGLLFVAVTTLVVAGLGGAFAGSWAGGLGIFPIILLASADFGVIQEGAIFTITLFFLLGGAILYAKGVSR